MFEVELIAVNEFGHRRDFSVRFPLHYLYSAWLKFIKIFSHKNCINKSLKRVVNGVIE